MKKINTTRGFTLIELLLVIAVIVALAVTVFVALNPATRLANARDARRTADVDSLLTATQEYIVDNAGTLPTGIPTSSDAMIGTCAGNASTTNGVAVTTNGCNILATTTCFNASTTYAKYLSGAPMDPLATLGFASSTDYAITASSSGIVTVKACGVEKLSQLWESR
jgi:prepilin-type N-terminal cleavage/methylation domain-containing protein